MTEGKKILNKTEVARLMGEAYGEWYWLNRGRRDAAAGKPALRPDADQEDIVGAILRYRKYRAMYKDAPPEQNERGNFIYRDVAADQKIGLSRGHDRYRYDFADGFRKDWKQYDTREDASYYGVWVNVKERRVFSYVEGDRTLVECPTLESFKAELADMEKFYGPPPPAFIACDGIGVSDGKFVPEGNVEYFYDKRPTADDA